MQRRINKVKSPVKERISQECVLIKGVGIAPSKPVNDEQAGSYCCSLNPSILYGRYFNSAPCSIPKKTLTGHSGYSEYDNRGIAST